MSLFKYQPGYCCVCGQQGNYRMEGPIVCSETCRDEYGWRETLYIMGKEYYPRKIKHGCTCTCQSCVEGRGRAGQHSFQNGRCTKCGVAV